MGFCMSGGGFRAMVFHLGALWRLNELGLLSKIKRFSSVSGGSITNGVLAKAWPRLAFDALGVARDFVEAVARPILAFARTDVDVAAVAAGLLPGGSAAASAARAYDRALFSGATLRDLPAAPRFNFNATNLMTTGLFRISQDYAGDYRVGRIFKPTFRLAELVAASAAFPPVLSPLDLRFAGQTLVPEPGAALARAPYTTLAVLTDSSVYDNLGLESVWKRYRTILVSNAGRDVEAQEAPTHLWPLQLYRVVNIMLNQVDNARERYLMALAKGGFRTVAYWAIETDPVEFSTSSPLFLSPAERSRSAAIATRLKGLTRDECRLLVRHAYYLSDLAVRRYVDPSLPPAASFPDLSSLVS